MAFTALTYRESLQKKIAEDKLTGGDQVFFHADNGHDLTTFDWVADEQYFTLARYLPSIFIVCCEMTFTATSPQFEDSPNRRTVWLRLPQYATEAISLLSFSLDCRNALLAD